MTDTIDRQIPNGKIFKDKAFWVGIFLGGPLVAGYLFSENFKTFGQPDKVKPTWIISIIVTILIFGFAFLIPENINIPNQLIPITYTAIAYGLFHKIQSERATQHINSGGLIHSWGKVIVVGLIGLLITLLPILAIAYTYDTVEKANITTKTYGATVKHEIDFDKNNITEKEVDLIADGFIETGFFDLSVAKYVYVVKNENKYELYISVIEGIENDQVALQPFIELRSQMDDYIPTMKVEIKLVVDYVDNVVKILK
ncbi:MAG: hypothetical protein EOL88_14415 [Bacteroidia bacterium]|nr:hypothetical protein [Bacteroidia bacterium]